MTTDGGRVCRPLSRFSDGRSVAMQIASATPRRNQSLSWHLTATSSRLNLWISSVMFSLPGKSVFLEPFRQGISRSPDVRRRTVGTFDGVHQTCLFFFFYLNFDLFIEVFNKQTNCILMITSNSALCGSGRQEQSLLKFMYG